MERVCYQCGTAIDERSAFCASCRAPQIRVPSREPETYGSAPPPIPQQSKAGELSIALTSQGGLAPRTSIRWKSFLRTAAPLAALAAFFIAVFPPLGWLLFLPASVIASVHLYRRRWRDNLRAGYGARMGAVVGLLIFVLSSLLFLVGTARDPDRYRQAVDEAVRTLQQVEARNPEGPRISQTLAGPHGIVLFTCLSLMSLLAFLLIIGCATGVFYVILSRRSYRP